MGPSGLGSGAGQSTSAERLRADDSANHVSVHVDVAVRKAVRDVGNGRIDAGMDAESERRTVRGNVVEKTIELIFMPSHDMQHRAEHLFLQLARAVELQNGGRNVGTLYRHIAVETEQHRATLFRA